MNNRILFVHIPKTAGTSFRLAAEEYFGKNNTFYDYSPKAAETSKEILQHVYEDKDMYTLSQVFIKYEKLFLSGHFPVGKYMPLFDTLNVITFVRDPIEQVISHYAHYKKHHHYKKSLQDFIEEKRFQNIQSRLIKAKPLELYGFVGLTEAYEKSIELINAYYGFELKVLQSNTNKNKKISSEQLDQTTYDLIRKLNHEDILLYEKAKNLFEKRVAAYHQNMPYTHILVQEQNKNQIQGIAIQRNTTTPIDIDIQDGENQKTIKASVFRPGLLQHRLPREGFVGFEYTSERSNKVKLI